MTSCLSHPRLSGVEINVKSGAQKLDQVVRNNVVVTGAQVMASTVDCH
jgi:hypothetical protein